MPRSNSRPHKARHDTSLAQTRCQVISGGPTDKRVSKAAGRLTDKENCELISQVDQMAFAL